MSTVADAVSPLNSLLQDIGRELEGENVRYMKFLLQGHISRETLQYLDTGVEITEALRTRGLVSEKRLAFLRKLLVEAKCLKLVNLVDDFKEKFSPGVSFGDRDTVGGAARRKSKREAVLRMIEGLENEIKGSEDDETDLVNETKEYEVQIQTNNERMVVEEDEIQTLKETIKEEESHIESYGRKLETVRFFLKKHQVEIDKIKQKLEQNRNSAGLKMDLKEEMEEFEQGKKEEDELVSKHQKSLDDIRSIHVEIRHRTEGMIKLEDHIHDSLMQIRIVKQNIRKNQRVRMDLQEKLDNLSLELEETNRQKPITPAVSARARSQLTTYSITDEESAERKVEYKVLDYGEITERESTVIGRKGKGSSPPRFNSPVSVATNSWGHLYVADYGNGRVHVLDIGGKALREPLNIGGKCRPCALAVSLRGDIVMTDSQIVRVFNRNGEFLRPILPIYSKNDRRPELCSVAFDNQNSVYIGDRANHRIQKFSFEGKFLFFIGSPQEIHHPMGIVVTRHGDVIASDYERHRLMVFFHEDMFNAKTIGAKGIGVCKFAFPRGIALDREENILVADSQNHRIHVVTIEGQYIGSFGTIGEDPGCLNTPYDVNVDTSGNVIVADTKNHRVQVFTRLVPVYVMYSEEDMTGKNDLTGGGVEDNGSNGGLEGGTEMFGCVDDDVEGYQGDKESEAGTGVSKTDSDYFNKKNTHMDKEREGEENGENENVPEDDTDEREVDEVNRNNEHEDTKQTEQETGQSNEQSTPENDTSKANQSEANVTSRPTWVNVQEKGQEQNDVNNNLVQTQ